MAAYGAWSLVLGSIGIATATMINPLIVGLVGLGTVTALASLPAAISASRRGRGEFALGQALLGALCNLLLLLGVLAITRSPAIEPSLSRFELPALFALALAIYPMMRNDGQLSSREGTVLVMASIAFMAAELWLSTT
ncbi:MAG: sodium:calcium antiporter, partial [Dokdonella sp.]